MRTQPAHLRIEATLDLLSTRRTVSDYEFLLSRWFSFYRELETSPKFRSGWELIGLDFECRRKTHLLRNDLLSLGWSENDFEKVVRCGGDRMPLVETSAQALGIAYVLEGSMMGGQVIARHFQKLLTLAPDRGFTFFTAYGDQLRIRWSEFSAALNGYSISSEFENEVVEAAIQTFEKLSDWLSDESETRHQPGAANPDAAFQKSARAFIERANS